MSKNIEMEKRVMLTSKEYEKLLNYSKAFTSKKEFTLINHYFDDIDLSLRSHHYMLRIRNINDKDYEITLKVKGDNGDLEINEPILESEVNNCIKKFSCNKKLINEYINEVTSKEIKYITSLKTERIEIPFNDYLFVLDKNYYSDVIDCNLEIEAHTIEDAKKTIKKYCREFKLQYSKDYQSKSRRAINKALNL